MKILHTLVTAVSIGTCTTAWAGTELSDAIKSGRRVLTSGEIAALVVGKVVTATSGDKTFRFFYSPENALTGELVDGGWSGAGSYAITDTGQICVSMAPDNGRYRCLTVVHEGDRIRKFDTNGKSTFELSDFEPATGL